ncbi:MAG: hypothetical protein KatS3mg096_786 [Candidatus Parcubacteria bacterium]|nr:MAG: hypothetical protein KatS3mg096_786 [Candidatus Parcubacteria bacterium]
MEIKFKHYFRLVCGDCGQDIRPVYPSNFDIDSQIIMVLDSERCERCHSRNLEVVISTLKIKLKKEKIK